MNVYESCRTHSLPPALDFSPLPSLFLSLATQRLYMQARVLLKFIAACVCTCTHTHTCTSACTNDRPRIYRTYVCRQVCVHVCVELCTVRSGVARPERSSFNSTEAAAVASVRSRQLVLSIDTRGVWLNTRGRTPSSRIVPKILAAQSRPSEARSNRQRAGFARRADGSSAKLILAHIPAGN